MSTLSDAKSAQKALEHARKGDFVRSLAELRSIKDQFDKDKTAIQVAEMALVGLEPVAVEIVVTHILDPKKREGLSLLAGRIQINRRELFDACCVVGL